MPKNFLIIFLFLLFLTTLVNAQTTQFPNGSFETGDTTDWNIAFTTANIGNFANCGAAANNASVAVNTGWASDGAYSLDVSDADVGNFSCGTVTNSVLNTFSGYYRFYVDINTSQSNGNCTTGSACKIAWLKNGAVQNVYPGSNNCLDTPQIQAGNPSVKDTLTCDFNGTNFYTSLVYTTGSVGNILHFRLDNLRYEQVPQLQHNVVEEGDPFPIDTNFSIIDYLKLDTNGMIVPDANCTINFDGVNAKMVYQSSIGGYEYTYLTTVPKTVYYGIGCSYPGQTANGQPGYYNPDANVTGSVTFTVDLNSGSKLTVTDIQNVSHAITSTQVNFTPANTSNQIIYSIKNNYTTSLVVPQHIFNGLIDGRQYFVYSASQPQYTAGIWVFNDSLTFGISQDDPVQKIWDQNNLRYDYSFSDIILSNETKYYKIVYKNPYRNYEAIGDSTDWYTVLAPQVSDGNSVSIDIYQTSAFSNIRSIYIPPIPDIFGDENSAFEFQFTAYADSNAVILNAGQTLYDSDSTSSITLSTVPHRYSFTINGTNFNSQILLKSSSTSPHIIHIYDYTIVPRGYFTKRLDLLKSNGDALDLFLLSGRSKKYLQEGNPFIAKAQAYDREGLLTQLKVEAFFDQTGDDVNKVSYNINNLSTGNETTFDFYETIPGVVDLNGNATFPTTPRDFIVKATLYDTLGNAISEQSQPIKFVQFPYFGGDFFLQFFPTEKRKGKNPSGVIQINTQNIDALEGLDIRIYDQNSSITSPDYLKKIYNGTDFTCVTGQCSFNIKIDDFLYEDANLVHFVVTGMLNTEYFSLTNPLIQVDRTIFLSQISFDVAKIYQTIERVNANILLANEYRNNEEIPLFLALRTGDKDSLKNILNPYLTLTNCDADANFAGFGNCVAQTHKWYPTGYLYDEISGYNIYFFRNIFLLDNGQLLPDGNFIGFRATLADNKGITNPIIPVLAPRCNNQGVIDLVFCPTCVLSAISNFIGFTAGCQIGVQSDVVTTTQNSNQEVRIHINNAKTTTAPAFPGQLCLAPDTNNIVADALKQDIICLVTYAESETPIDNFRFRLGSQYSDYSVTGSNKQYVEINVPYELISYNDPILLKAQLESKGSTITTVGDFYYELLKDATINTANALNFPSYAKFLLKNGVIPNIGGDINVAALNQAFSATTVRGTMVISIKGVPVVNVQDFKYNSKVSADFDNIDRKNFLSYLSTKGVPYKTLVPAQANVIVSNIQIPVKLYDQNGSIVIDELPSVNNINSNNADGNHSTNYGNKVPAKIVLNLSTTMFFNNFGSSTILSNIITIYAFFFQKIGDFFAGIFDGLVNPNPNSDPVAQGVGFLYSNILYIIVSLGFIYAAVVVRDRYLGMR